MKDQALDRVDVDQLGQALITITKEIWVLKDRQRVLETVLAEAGLLDRVNIDTYQPDQTLEEELRDERQKLINTVIDALTTSPAETPEG
jgi:hypothetical protein